MSTPVVFNGINYSVPAFGDVGYAQGPGNLSSYLIAIASGTFQTVGGSFILTSQANFGPNFGLTALDFISVTALPATVGVLRLAKTDTIDWRNNANSTNLPLGINGTDQLTFNGNIISNTTANGTVNTGVANRVAFYPASTNTVDDTTAFIVGANGPNGIIVGTNTNDNAASGIVGEYVESVVSGVLFPATTVWGDLTSISLTAGDWDVTFNIFTVAGGAGPQNWSAGISTTPGNSTVGLVLGSNQFTNIPAPVNGVTAEYASIPNYRQSFSTTTTVYAKISNVTTGVSQTGSGRLSARRIR